MTDAIDTAQSAHDFTQLKADFVQLSNSVAELMKAQTKAATHNFSDALSQSGDQINAKMADFGHSAKNMSDQAQVGLRSATHDIEQTINNNPLTAVLVAAGVGLLFGLISARN